MSIKTTGAEFKRYYNDPVTWPVGQWHDDEMLTVDGKDVNEHDIELSTVPDAALVIIDGGCVYINESSNDGPIMESHFRKWKKTQTAMTMLIEIPKKDLEATTHLFKSLHIKILQK